MYLTRSARFIVDGDLSLRISAYLNRSILDALPPRLMPNPTLRTDRRQTAARARRLPFPSESETERAARTANPGRARSSICRRPICVSHLKWDVNSLLRTIFMHLLSATQCRHLWTFPSSLAHKDEAAPRPPLSLSVIFCVSAPATRQTGLRGRVLRLKSPPSAPPPSLFIYPPVARFAAFFVDRISRGKPRERKGRKRGSFLYDVCFIFGTIFVNLSHARHRHHLRFLRMRSDTRSSTHCAPEKIVFARVPVAVVMWTLLVLVLDRIRLGFRLEMSET